MAPAASTRQSKAALNESTVNQSIHRDSRRQGQQTKLNSDMLTRANDNDNDHGNDNNDNDNNDKNNNDNDNGW